MIVDPAVRQCVADFVLPASLKFGETKIPAMYTAAFRDGRWQEGTLEPYRALQIDPAARVLHYAVEAFEGLKAYRSPNGRPRLFRPDRNCLRLNRSLARLAARPLPREIFFEGIHAMADISASLIPSGP